MSAEVVRDPSALEDSPSKHGLSVTPVSDESSSGPDVDPDAVRLQAAAESDKVEGGEDESEGRSDDSDEGAAENAEEEECGFCLFMKSGPCGKRFSLWEECVEGAETIGDNIVEKCWQTTQLLKQCMEMNPEYYGPVLQAERSLQAESAAEGESVAKPQASETQVEVQEKFAAA